MKTSDKTYVLESLELVLDREHLDKVPFVMAAHLEQGTRHIGAEWSMRWVRERIIPPSRQNIGQILRANGLKKYDEYALLIKNQGRSCQDEFYLEPINGKLEYFARVY